MEARTRPAGLGCMRLSTATDRDEARTSETIAAALDAGATLLDTANVYCPSPSEIGHNERLVAAALSGWAGDRTQVCVATKGGLTRPGGRWVPDGRAKSLMRACEASLEALGVDRIDLYQLHAPDPRVPLATSVRALAKLQRDGLVREIGLCNVNLGQLREAATIAPIASVQVELGVLCEEPLRNGVAEYCREHGLRLIAHSPLGGPKKGGPNELGRLARFAELASAMGSTPAELALAWLADLAPFVLPIPGATRPETATSSVRAQLRELSDDERAALDARLAAGRRWRIPRARRRPPASAPADVVLVMGLPAAGKSERARSWVERGHSRLNRDERGGSLDALAAALGERLAAGERRFVLDNTYGSRAARNEVVERAWEHGVNVRCEWLTTSLEEAQANAVWRMLEKYGRLLSPEEIRARSRADPGTFLPQTLFDHRRTFEPPAPDEGFTEIEEIAFERRPVRKASEDRALLVDYDGVLRRSRSGARTPTSPGDVELLPGRADALRRYADDGWRLLGQSWQPEIEEQKLDEATVAACFERTHELLGVSIDASWCPHRGGPPRCWCRKPLPGLALALLAKHGLDPARCRFVGSGAADRSFAARLGFEFVDAEEL